MEYENSHIVGSSLSERWRCFVVDQTTNSIAKHLETIREKMVLAGCLAVPLPVPHNTPEEVGVVTSNMIGWFSLELVAATT
jgi:hypothetical protein